MFLDIYVCIKVNPNPNIPRGSVETYSGNTLLHSHNTLTHDHSLTQHTPTHLYNVQHTHT